jgi:hypothetical protein
MCAGRVVSKQSVLFARQTIMLVRPSLGTTSVLVSQLLELLEVIITKGSHCVLRVTPSRWASSRSSIEVFLSSRLLNARSRLRPGKVLFVRFVPVVVVVVVAVVVVVVVVQSSV